MIHRQGRYAIIRREFIKKNELILRSIAPNDIEPIRQWRNTQMDVLRQSTPISPADQQRYFETHVWPEMDSLTPKQLLFAIEVKEKLIGYGGLVHICWQDRRAEVSFLLDTKLEAMSNQRNEVFKCFLALMAELTFIDIDLYRLWTETYETRVAHIHALEASGFELEGCLKKHVIVQGIRVDSLIHGLNRDKWGERKC